MGRPRKPNGLALITGAARKNPQRYRGRNEPPSSGELGDAPEYIRDTDDCHALSAWHATAKEAPWLNRSHRSLVELCSLLRGEIMAGGMPGIQRMNSLRQVLTALGLTPTAKITASKPAAEDPDDEFFR